MALKPSLPRKIVRASGENHVHPTSPIWGSEGQDRAATGIQGAPQGARITLSLAAFLGKLGYLHPPTPLRPLLQLPGNPFKM